MATEKSAVSVCFGAMTFGAPGTHPARVHDTKDCAAILDIFQKYGHKEVDTSRTYNEGTSEEYLAAVDWEGRGLAMQTKIYPSAMAPKLTPGYIIHHSPEDLRKYLLLSLEALKTKKIDMWYLHGPDRSIPYETTMKAVNDLYKEGYFTRFGLSNFQAWEVARICEICKANGWIQPTVYQGVYNALYRSVEPELFPCLRYYGMSYYAYNPLAGGWLTDRYHRDQNNGDQGSRFDKNTLFGSLYMARYWKDSYFDSLDLLRAAAAKHGLTEAECALRWMNHHSMMKREHGDTIIIGASSTKHIEANMIDLDKGPLPEEVVKALDAGWELCKGESIKYWH